MANNILKVANYKEKYVLMVIFLCFCKVCIFTSCHKKKEIIVDIYKCSFFNSKQQEVTLNLNSFTSFDSLYSYLSANNLYYSVNKISKSLNNKIIIENERITQNVKNTYNWSSQLSDTLVNEYLLPIRIGKEDISDWKPFFLEKYKDRLDSLNNLKGINRVKVAEFLLSDISKWYQYDDRVLNLKYPDLQILLFNLKGDCYRFAYIYSMCLRACGIPATVDLTPYWGNNRVGGHSEVSVLNDDNKFETNINTVHKNGLRGAAKVYRLKDGCEEFLWVANSELHDDISFLSDLAYQDVTSEHTTTTFLVIRLDKEMLKNSIAYLCVLNGDKWHPIFPAKIDHGTVYFKNVGTGVQYKVATMNDSGELIFIDEIFNT